MKILSLFAASFVYICGSAQTQYITFEFDRANRLKKISDLNSEIVYKYDGDGNRIGLTEALPLTLLDFKAQRAKESVVLTWETTNEIKVGKFEVEFSLDATNFHAFATVIARNSSQQINDYTTLHCCPALGTNFYRLKIIDKDGKFTYSQIRTVVFESNNAFKIYPNPVTNNNLSISFDKSLDSNAEVYIYNSIGSTVLMASFPNGQSLYNLQLPTLTSGTYFIIINTKNKIYQSKFVK